MNRNGKLTHRYAWRCSSVRERSSGGRRESSCDRRRRDALPVKRNSSLNKTDWNTSSFGNSLMICLTLSWRVCCLKFTSEIDWATEMIPKEQKTHKTNVNTQKKDKKGYRKKRATGSILWYAIEPKSYGSYRIIVILRVISCVFQLVPQRLLILMEKYKTFFYCNNRFSWFFLKTSHRVSGKLPDALERIGGQKFVVR